MLSLLIKLLFSTLYEVSLGCVFQIIQIPKSNQILIKILLTVSCVVVVFLNANIYVFDLYKIAFNFLMFNLERHQRGLFSPGQLQWLLPAMQVIKLQHPTKHSL